MKALSMGESEVFHDFPIPYAPCMEYLPTFTINLSQMSVKYTICGSYGVWICFATQHIGSKLLLLHVSRLLKNHINATICDQVGSVESFHVLFCWCLSLSRL